jgi:hypothetical protein
MKLTPPFVPSHVEHFVCLLLACTRNAVNVLIAIVSDINTDVAETAEVEVRKLRAQRIVDEDALMSHSQRDRNKFPEYLEVLQARSPDGGPPSEGALLEKKVGALALEVAATP